MPPNERMQYLRDKKTPRCQRTSYQGGYWPIQCLRAAKAEDAKGILACGQHLAADKARVTRAVHQEQQDAKEQQEAYARYGPLSVWLLGLLHQDSPRTRVLDGPTFGHELYVQVAVEELGTVGIILLQTPRGASYVAQEAPTVAAAEES